MPYTVFVHVVEADPVLMEVEQLPNPTDNFIVGSNPRLRDGREVPFVLPEVNTVIFPWHRISFIEVMPTGEEEEVITFVRDR